MSRPFAVFHSSEAHPWGLGEMTQSIKSLLGKHDLSISLRIHVACLAWSHVFVILTPRRQRQVYPLCLWANQLSQSGELQYERPCLKGVDIIPEDDT